MEDFEVNGNYFGYIEVNQTFLNKLVPKTIFSKFAIDESGNQKKWKDVSRKIPVGDKIFMQCGFYNEFGSRFDEVGADEFKLFFNYFSGLIIRQEEFDKLQNQQLMILKGE